MKLNLAGKQLLVSTNWPIEPYIYAQKSQETSLSYPYVMIGGIDYLLMNTLAHYFNFSWTPIYAHHIWSETINGTHKGMIGEVHYGKADLSIGELSITYERNQLVDFTMPYAIEPVTFLSRNVDITSRYGLITFFIQNAWISYCILGAISISIIIPQLIQLVITDKTKLYGEKNTAMIVSVQKNLTIIFEALLLKPHSSSLMLKMRHHQSVLSIFWRIFSMLFLVFFSTFIFTSLIRDADSIESIEELRIAVNEGRVRVRYKNLGTSVSDFLKGTDFDFVLRAKSNGVIIPDSKITSFRETCERMINSEPDLVFVSYRIRNRMLIRAYGENNLKLPPDSSDASFTADLLAIAFPKGSILTKEFSRIIMHLNSAGFIKYWTHKNVDRINSGDDVSLINVTLNNNKSPIRNEANNKLDTSISLNDIRLLFLIIEACAAISLLRLIYEKISFFLFES